ncbi:uncharacterized protein LOC131254007 [Magnolia sinica]|uniref:uncharacterized protein LOC131254007 n=1 Tax=Magnolia sinica TaxID=86752 RepID=UPI00265A0BEE|nr:uncharacterized protein LOC131254007 [Magnolia sinica]
MVYSRFLLNLSELFDPQLGQILVPTLGRQANTTVSKSPIEAAAGTTVSKSYKRRRLLQIIMVILLLYLVNSWNSMELIEWKELLLFIQVTFLIFWMNWVCEIAWN